MIDVTPNISLILWYYSDIGYKLEPDASLHNMKNTDFKDFLGFALVLVTLTYLSLGESRDKYISSFPSAFVNFFTEIFSSKAKNNTSPAVIDKLEPITEPKTNLKDSPELTAKEKKPSIKKEKEKEEQVKKQPIKEEPKPKAEIKIQPAPVPKEKKEEKILEPKATVSIPKKGTLIYYDTPPELRGKLNLDYPKNARAEKIEGTVFVEFFINTDGSVLKADIYQGLEKSLNDAAIDAVLNSKWKPATDKGRPVAIWIVVPIEFKIKQDFY